MQDVTSKKSYEDFKKIVMEEIEERVEGRVEVQTITKNNGIKLDGLMISEAGVNIRPTIYLNHYYDKFLRNGLNVVVDEIFSVYERNKMNDSIDISFFTDADKVRGKIRMKLVNYERNKELLEKIPHVKCMDLVIVFFVEIINTDDEVATTLIHNRYMKFWNFTTEDLLKIANENMAEDFKIVSLADIAGNIMGEDFEEIEMDILTNRRKLNGAIGMLKTNLLLEHMEKQHIERLVIIPSSIHEVLLIPYEPETDVDSLRKMVHEVNGTQLLPEEILSDNVYIYDGNEIKVIE